MSENNLNPTPQEKIELQKKQLRQEKIRLYNLKEQIQKQLQIARKNNQGTGLFIVQIEDINEQLKQLKKQLNKLNGLYSYFNY